MNPRTLAWLVLNHVPGAGAVTLRRLVSGVGSPEATLQASVEQLVAIGSLSPAQAQELKRLAAGVGDFEDLAADLQRRGTHLLTFEDESYPSNLRALRDAPPLLYVRGSLLARDHTAVAVIGTRTPSDGGIAATTAIARGLADRDVTIVSGLARGVDGAAHRGALEAGRTIAVLGSGIDRVTPQRHHRLAQEITRRGALLSEIPPGARASREALLARNRIQAGLAKAVVVAQCRSRGGSFATARRALAAARSVLAVRWDETEFADGPKRLGELGARVVSASDAVDLAAEAAFKPLPPSPQREIALDDPAQRPLGE
ncbi:MAG: DNA-processing protein DprA [Armatimonadota bacterium]|nr:MAG: DNA-processing protein DprA [Armatimonadota bacterium]